MSGDDRLDSPHYGYAFNCIDGTGLAVRSSRNVLLQGNQVIEHELRPTPALKERYRLGQFVRNDLWSIGLMPGASSRAATPGPPVQPPNVDGGHIVANNIRIRKSDPFLMENPMKFIGEEFFHAPRPV